MDIYIIIYGIYYYILISSTIFFSSRNGRFLGSMLAGCSSSPWGLVLLSQQKSLSRFAIKCHWHPLTMYTWVGGQIHVRNRTKYSGIFWHSNSNKPVIPWLTGSKLMDLMANLSQQKGACVGSWGQDSSTCNSHQNSWDLCSSPKLWYPLVN